MNIEAVISQSIKIQNKPVQQLSNLVLTGFSTIDDVMNTDDGRLYGSFVLTGGNYVLSLYSDTAKTQLVASGTSASLGLAPVVEQNDSGITGTVNIVQYVQDDTNISVVCFLSTDANIPLSVDILNGLTDYDAENGFATYHLLAFDDIKRVLKSRYTSELWNRDLVDVNQINGGKGGYDLSRVLNWGNLREASAHWVLWHIAEKQDVQDGTFRKRAADSKAIYRAYLSEQEVQFDLDVDRVMDKSRTFSTWRIGRA